VPGFSPLFASSWLWQITRWGGLFVGTYLVTKLTGSPLLSQLAGASIFAPMLFGGMAAGVLSDRFDRHRMIWATHALLIPVSVAMAVVVEMGAVRVWMIFPFMLVLGAGGLVNMTAQRTLLYDTVGPGFASRALTWDTMGMAAASVASTLLGGVFIQVIGIGAAFGLLTAALSLSALTLRWVPRPARSSPPGLPGPVGLSGLSGLPGPPVTLRDRVAIGFGLARRSPSVRSLLAITVLVNVFYFSFIPLVPAMAQRLGANALLTGVLASAAGFGQLAGSVRLAAREVAPGDRGRLFVGGAIVALCGLAAFAVAPLLAVACAALFVAGVGTAAYSSMQSLLAIESAGGTDQGAALGLLSTAIGSLPLGMLAVGLTAQAFGAPLTLFACSVAGMTSLLGWLRRGPSRHPPVPAVADLAA
jgi:predicted MFS family arabinose efflux permease